LPLARQTSQTDRHQAITGGVVGFAISHRSAGSGARAQSRRAKLLAGSVAVAVAGILAGCDTTGLIDPSQTVRGGSPTEPLVVPILYKLDPNDEPGNTEFVNAQPPTAADMVTSAKDYAISANDLLQISISDLNGPGLDTIKTARVTESGNISLPNIGPVRAEGLTEYELEQAIASAYRTANIIANATVSVTVAEPRGRTVEIMGAVQSPGQYAILDPEFRLIDALVLARDVTTPTLDYIYVIRKSESHRPHAPAPMPATAPTGGNPGGDGIDLAPRGAPSTPGGPARPPASAPAPDDLAPHSQIQQPDAPVLASDVSPAHPLSLLAEAPGANNLAPGTATGDAPAGAAGRSAPPSPSQTPGAVAGNPADFQFNAPPSNGNVRVIRIPYQALRNGDLKYNIAIHPRDIIWVQTPMLGEYYMAGHVARPGVYTLTGRKITLKQAIESAGMFDELAIPQRTDVIRRIDPDREVYVRIDLSKIFAGEAPDVFLKPNDQVVVGTNALAPFLTALRGAFRITYGFGFLYDRNYAYSTGIAGGGGF